MPCLKTRWLAVSLALCALLPARAKAQEEPDDDADAQVVEKQVPPRAGPARPFQPGDRRRKPLPAPRPPQNQPGPEDAQRTAAPPPPMPSGAPGIHKVPQTPMPSAPVGPTADREPAAEAPIDHKTAARRQRTTLLRFEARDLMDVIKFVSEFTDRNFILPERVNGKITILSNTPVNPDEVWNVFLAALDANNWALYPVGHYWKLSEKRQSARANIPTYLEDGQEIPATEQMVTKIFKLRFVEADQMRNTLSQFTSRDADFQVFGTDTLIISDLGLNMRRLEKLAETLDRPGGSEELHLVQVRYASAADLATKLNEIFQTQKGTHGFGIVTAGPAGMPPPPAPGGAPGATTPGAPGGPVQVSKIIAEERTNKLIVIASSRSFERVMDLVAQLDVPAGDGGVHVYPLSNAKAEDVANTLNNLAQGMAGKHRGAGGAPAPGVVAPPGADASITGEVKITADKGTNSLVIVGSAADYRALVKVVERLDLPRKQVYVEAVIMEVNVSDDTTVGAGAHVGSTIDNVSFRNAQGSAPIAIGSEPGSLNSLGGLASLLSAGGFLAGLQGPPVNINGFSLPAFGVLVQALENSGNANVISTPNLVISDNSEGEITVGENVPFPAGYSPGGAGGLGSLLGLGGGTTGTTGTGVNPLVGLGGLGSLYAPIQRQNVELRLKLKPQISQDDAVRLEVDEQTEDISGTDPKLGPTTAKRTAKTTVVTRDQQTVVIGGLIQERDTKNVAKVPVLGSIPILGWLFRSETTKKQKSNLLLFLTPYIIREQADYHRILQKKLEERSEFVRQYYGEGPEYAKSLDYENKQGLLTRMHDGIRKEVVKSENGGIGEDDRVITPGHGAAKPASAGNAPATSPASTTPAAPSAPPPVAPASAGPGATLPSTTPPAPKRLR